MLFNIFSEFLCDLSILLQLVYRNHSNIKAQCKILGCVSFITIVICKYIVHLCVYFVK